MRKFALPEAADGSRGGMICFDRFAIDLDRGSLREGSNEVWLRPKSLAVLRYLAENAGRLILKDEIFAALWPDAPVTDDSLVQCIRQLRRALCDDEQRLIKTVARQNWPAPPGEHSTAEGHEYTTWYQPWDDQRTITAAVSWALSLPGVTGLATPGDVALLGMVVEAERSRIDPAEAASALDAEPAYSSPFIDMPI